MIAGTAPENETTRPRILSFDFARITDRSNFSSTDRTEKKLDSTEAHV